MATIITTTLLLFLSLPAFSYDVYEDYLPVTDSELNTLQNNAINIAQQSGVSDELRRSIRNEIYGNADGRSDGVLDDVIRKALDKEMHRITHEETEKAVNAPTG